MNVDLPNVYRLQFYFDGQAMLQLFFRNLSQGTEIKTKTQEALDAFIHDGTDTLLTIQDDFSNDLSCRTSSLKAILGCACKEANVGHTINKTWGTRLTADMTMAALDDPEIKAANARLRAEQMRGPLVMPPAGTA